MHELFFPNVSITKEEVIKELRECTGENKDGEHMYADSLLCQFLVTLGYSDIVEEFQRLDKWYA